MIEETALYPKASFTSTSDFSWLNFLMETIESSIAPAASSRRQGQHIGAPEHHESNRRQLTSSFNP
jgi:hypothetical protein